jgi:hypothetical protein
MDREENKLKNEYIRHIFPKLEIYNEALKNQKHNIDCIPDFDVHDSILYDFDIYF